MTKPVYDHDNRYLPGTQEMSDDAARMIMELFRKYVAKGYSPRDVSHIIELEVIGCEMVWVL